RAAGGLPGRDIVDHHRLARHRGCGRTAAEGGREVAAHGHVQDDEEAVVGRVGPGTGVHVGRADLVELHPVEVEADGLRLDAAVPLQAVGVEASLAGGTGARPLAADAAELVTRAAGGDPAVHGRPLVVQALDVLHDVQLTDAGPVPVVAPVGGAEHPE